MAVSGRDMGPGIVYTGLSTPTVTTKRVLVILGPSLGTCGEQ